MTLTYALSLSLSLYLYWKHIYSSFLVLYCRCLLSEINRFKLGEVPLSPPSPKYVNILIKGLVEGKQLTEAEALNYIDVAASKKL